MEQMTTIPGAPTFPSEPPKKFSVSELGVIFWGSPLFFGRFLAIDALEGQLPLIFGPISTKLGGNRPDHQKNNPEGQRTRSGPELRRNGRFLRSAEKWFFGLKMGLTPKKSPKMTFPPLIIWAKALFFFEHLFPVMARTWLGEKVTAFFWAQNFGFWPKNQIFAIRPQFWSMTHFEPSA